MGWIKSTSIEVRDKWGITKVAEVENIDNNRTSDFYLETIQLLFEIGVNDL